VLKKSRPLKKKEINSEELDNFKGKKKEAENSKILIRKPRQPIEMSANDSSAGTSMS
jgi:hypothetical protein